MHTQMYRDDLLCEINWGEFTLARLVRFASLFKKSVIMFISKEITIRSQTISSIKVVFRTIRGYKKERKNVLFGEIIQPQRRGKRCRNCAATVQQ